MKHPGFAGATKQVEAKEGYGPKTAARIIGAASHKAGAAAIKKNPNLKNVPGVGAPKKPKKPTGAGSMAANMMDPF